MKGDQGETGETTWDVRGRTVLVTGGNSGIGRATALELARRGAEVVFTYRDGARGRAAEEELRHALAAERIDAQGSGDRRGSIEGMPLDLADFQSILAFAKAFCARYPRLHVLVHNAGLFLSERRETVDGFEATFGTNHMGPFILTRLLLEHIKRSAPARIVVVASAAHAMARHGLDLDDLQSKHGYQGAQAYGRSKLANILFTRALAKRLIGSGVTANCLHPGVVATNFAGDGDASGLWAFVFRYLRAFLLSPERGARTSVHLATAPELDGVSGEYFVRCRRATPSGPARDEAAAEELWDVSEALCGAASLPGY